MLVATSQRRSKLELQLVVLAHESVHSEGRWTGKIENMEPIREMVQDFNPALQLAFAKAEYAWKWRLGETPDLPSWSSENGKVLLLGDAAHG